MAWPYYKDGRGYNSMDAYYLEQYNKKREEAMRLTSNESERRRDAANQILDYLSVDNFRAGTSIIRRKLGLMQDDHVWLRALLKQMAMSRILIRYGKGSFKWECNVTEWNRERPLATPDPSNVVNSTAALPVDRDGDDEDDEYKGPTPLESEQETESVPTPIHDGVSSSTPLLNSLTNRVVTLETKVRVIEQDKRENKEKTDEFLEQWTNFKGEIADIQKEVKTLKELALRTVRTLEVKKYDGTKIKLKDQVLPKQFEHILDLVSCRRPVMLVGPAGCGKSYIGKLVAKSLKLRFGALNCTAGMSEPHLLGAARPNLTTGKDRFRTTEFIKCYEEGGLFLLDELDAADPNLLLAINSALANEYCNIPNREDKPQAAQHEDFVCVATANTFGRGADRVYAGRNQLDEATLDRFRIGLVECDYDEAVEAALCPDEQLRFKLTEIRKLIEQAKIRRVVSSRFMRDAHIMVTNRDWTHTRVIQALTSGWTNEEKKRIEGVAA